MEELRIFLNSLSSDEQRMFACECGTSIGYLRKALSKGHEPPRVSWRVFYL